MSSGTQVIIFKPTAEQRNALEWAAASGATTMSDLLRRMMDRCLRPPGLNRLVPAMSGVNMFLEGSKE